MSEWPEVKLGDLLRQHQPTPISPQVDAQVRFAGVRWYGAGLFVRETRSGGDVKGKAYPLKPGLLIYNRLFAWKQSFAVVGDDYEGVVVSNEFPQFAPDLAKTSSAYVNLCCASPMFASRALGLSTGSAAVSRNRLKEVDFLSLSIPLPPRPHQERILQVMSAVDEAVAASEEEVSRLTDLLRVRRSALIDDDAGEMVRAVDAFDIQLGRQRSPGRSTGSFMTPYLRSANVGPDVLRLDDVLLMDFNERERVKYRLRVGDVLVSEGSAGSAAVGMPAMWRGELDGDVCFQNTLLRYRAIDAVTLPSYVRHWCLWAFESGAFLATAPAQVNIKHIGDGRAKAMMVKLPSLDRQQVVVEELDALAQAVASSRQEVARLKSARAALLLSMLSGSMAVAAA